MTCRTQRYQRLPRVPRGNERADGRQTRGDLIAGLRVDRAAALPLGDLAQREPELFRSEPPALSSCAPFVLSVQPGK